MKDRFKLIDSTDIFSHISGLSYLPRWIVLLFDIFLCVCSYLLSHYVTAHMFNGDPEIRVITFFERISFVIAIQIVFFWIYHTYSGVLRYSSYVDATKLLLAVISCVAFVSGVNLIFHLGFNSILYYYSSIFFYGISAFLFLLLPRIIVKNVFDLVAQGLGQTTPVMIYGTQTAAIGIAKMIKISPEHKFRLVGFIDDQKDSSSRMIMGVKVYHLNDQVVKNVVAKKAKAVIVTPLKMGAINPKEDLDIFINNGLSIMTSQPMSIWKDDMPTVKQIKSIQIEDLLERPQIEISNENIEHQLKSTVILVTGAAGSIGSEIVRQVIKFKPQLVVLVDQAESPLHTLQLELMEKFPSQNTSIVIGDVRNATRMEYVMEMFRPDYIYHAAAYKHVPMMEDNPIESIQVNVKGTKILADLAVKFKVKKFVMISTDKAVNPTNVMGASKRIAEIYVQSLFRKLVQDGQTTTKFITTRFGNVLGSNGSVIPHFKSQIEKGGPVTVTHPDIIRYFMTIPEACMLVLEAGSMGEGGEIFIFDMGSPVKIVDLAKKMIRLAGFVPEVDIQINYTGLRPGEKLYEELLNNKEITQQTYHPKIMIATVQQYDYVSISSSINELISLSESCKNFLTVAQMKKIVPEFKSKNSQYERLDS